MPTVVDSLVVEMELDPKKFDSGRKQAEEAFDKTKIKALDTTKKIEEAAAKTADGLGVVKNGVLGMFAAFTGVGLTVFMRNMIHADAATGRAAKTINMTTKDLGAWEGAAELAGAKTGELTAGMASLTNALKTAELTGDASLGAKFRQLFDIDVAGPNGLKTAAELYLEIASKASGMDPAKATTAMSILGVPAGVIPLLLQGKTTVEQLVAEMKKLGGLGDEGAAAAVRFENAWTRAFKAIQGAARPLYDVGSKIADSITYALNPENAGAIGNLADKNSEVSKLWWKKNFVSTKFEEPYQKALAELEELERQNAKAHETAATKGSEEALKQVGQGESGGSLPQGGAFKSNAEKEAYIRSEAARLGIDPNQAMRVAKSEGFYNFNGDMDATGKPTSFGAFQLHRPGIGRNTADGLGTLFKKQTGLDPSDPANERATISFALQHAANSGNGWKDWHGWKGAQFQGLPQPGQALGGSGGGGKTTSVTIGTIQINTKATDASGIAADIGPAIRRDMSAQQSNDGPQ